MASTPVNVLYIGGKGRSGSTILDLLLGCLPGFFAAGEVAWLWERGCRDNQLCGCGRRFHQCPFWSRVGEVAFGGWREIDADEMSRFNREMIRIRHLPWLLLPPVCGRRDQRHQKYATALSRLYSAIRDVSGCSVIVDASKHPSLATVLRGIPEIKLYLVHLIRDSRGVAYSRTKKVKRTEVTDKDVHMGRWHPAKTARKWATINAVFEILRWWLGLRGQRVIYEDLIREPQTRLRDLLGRSGLPYSSGDLGFLDQPQIRVRENHTVSGNPVRLGMNTVSLKVDEAWRTKLPSSHRRLVGLMTAPLLAYYGYPLRIREDNAPTGRSPNGN